MLDKTKLSDAKRVLLEKYLRGDVQPSATVASGVKKRAEAEVASPGECIVPVQVGGSRRPFFYLHGDWRGKIFYCHPLASALGPDQPFYVLEPYLFGDLQVPPTIEAIATAHLKSIRTIQPEGPYLLGGWCNGGLIAYEIAQQLYTQGQKVELLVLMDSMAPGRLSWVRSVISHICSPMCLGQDKQLDWFLLVRHLYRYLRFSHYRKLPEYARAIEQTRLEHRSDKVSPAPLRLASIVPASEALRQDYPGIFEWVASGYTPSPYPGKITFFWTSERTHRRVEWSKRTEAKEADVHVVPGNPTTSRTEYLPVLADHLRYCVNRAQTTTMDRKGNDEFISM